MRGLKKGDWFISNLEVFNVFQIGHYFLKFLTVIETWIKDSNFLVKCINSVNYIIYNRNRNWFFVNPFLVYILLGYNLCITEYW
jgi:hypothetical protein